MSTDLVSWFRDQLSADEDDADERHAFSCAWFVAKMGGSGCNCEVPAITRRTVAAHRAILDEFEQLRDDRRRLHDAAMHLQFQTMRRVVRTLLPIYEDRPGFDPSWRADP